MFQFRILSRLFTSGFALILIMAGTLYLTFSLYANSGSNKISNNPALLPPVVRITTRFDRWVKESVLIEAEASDKDGTI